MRRLTLVAQKTINELFPLFAYLVHLIFLLLSYCINLPNTVLARTKQRKREEKQERKREEKVKQEEERRVSNAYPFALAAAYYRKFPISTTTISFRPSSPDPYYPEPLTFSWDFPEDYYIAAYERAPKKFVSVNSPPFPILLDTQIGY